MKKINLKNQKGSTLLLSILVMAGISISVYATTGLTISFLNQSNNIIRGESSIVAADAALEQALWGFNRTEGMEFVGDCGHEYYPGGQLGDGLIQLDHCVTQFTASPVEYCIAVQEGKPNCLQGGENNEVMYLLVNPRIPNNENVGAGYIQVSFTALSGAGRITLCDWEEDCSPGSGLTYTHTASNQDNTIEIELDPNQRYVLYLEALEGANYVGLFEGLAQIGDKIFPRGLPTDTVTLLGRGNFGSLVSRAQSFKMVPIGSAPEPSPPSPPDDDPSGEEPEDDADDDEDEEEGAGGGGEEDEEEGTE